MAKLALAAALLVYLVLQAQQNESFERLVEQPKRWPLLATAVGLLATLAGSQPSLPSFARKRPWGRPDVKPKPKMRRRRRT